MEKLEYFFTNPYAWLFIVVIFALPYLLKYIRGLYPKELQKKIIEEEACVLKRNEKPEMKRMLKIINIGNIFALLFSALVAYLFHNFWLTYITLFVFISISVRYGIITERKINKGKKDKSCSKIYTKREIIMQIGIYGGLVVLLLVVIVMSGIGKIR